MKVDELFEARKASRDLTNWELDHIAEWSDDAPSNFVVFHNPKSKLTSLEGCPDRIWGNFYCDTQDLSSLKYGPTSCAGSFNIAANKLTSFENAPEIIGGSVYAMGNKITSLKNIHKQIKQLNGDLLVTENPIKSCVLGLLKIKYLKKVYIDNQKLQDIINDYLPEGDLVACQQELIEAGLDEYAQL